MRVQRGATLIVLGVGCRGRPSLNGPNIFAAAAFRVSPKDGPFCSVIDLPVPMEGRR